MVKYSPVPALVLSALALLLAVATVLSAAPSAQAVGPDSYLTAATKATNGERTSRGLAPLGGSNRCLERFAVRQAHKMADARQISHSSNFLSFGRRCGLRLWGENVAQALGDDEGRGVVGLWMDSESHRANILKRGYRQMGMGAVQRHGSWWVVQVFGTSA